MVGCQLSYLLRLLTYKCEVILTWMYRVGSLLSKSVEQSVMSHTHNAKLIGETDTLCYAQSTTTSKVYKNLYLYITVQVYKSVFDLYVQNMRPLSAC